jgi:hypothetical protein
LSEGETITSQQPQFFGKGPGGESIVITVHSQNPISATVQIPNTGSWSYSVPSSLEPGKHTVTISWVDASGITRLLTRDFVVQAGEVPAFTASRSGVATATPIATLLPSPTASASPTVMPVPVTGDLTPTIILFVMGISVIAFSFIAWKIAEN